MGEAVRNQAQVKNFTCSTGSTSPVTPLGTPNVPLGAGVDGRCRRRRAVTSHLRSPSVVVVVLVVASPIHRTASTFRRDRIASTNQHPTRTPV